ncbi:MAG: hypothetical protein DMF66_13225 [Acidobacteria bacterium]|nr:MAG: hypothetical protein DMF66_13225 [Acidobacteriota bacterium]
MLGECFVGSQIDTELYWQIVRRKAVAYNMILYKPLLVGVEKKLRLRLLSILARMDELAQLLNDYNDLQEDSNRGQLNAFTHGVYDHRSINEEFLARAQQLKSEAVTLPPAIRDALKAMFENVGINEFTGRRDEGESIP